MKCTSSIVEFKVEILDLFFKVGDSQFDLYMKVDTNTNGHRQWFYFSVRNVLPGNVRFNVYRFKKKFSLFQRGMKPYVNSIKSGKGWHPSSGKIAYRTQKYQTDHKNSNDSPTYYLTFEYKFQHAEDEVYFSAGIPYTISYLNKRLNQLLSFSNPQLQIDLSPIGKTLCGQDFQLLSVQPLYPVSSLSSTLPSTTSPSSSQPNYIIINARTHPGETSSSWVLDGLLQKLLTDENIKKWIIQNNIHFKIIPMLNLDGVFVGNYRTGIIGEDFNRKFATGKKELFPQIFLLKKVISDCKKNGRILLFLDLHGHSVLKNSFIYGPSQTLYTTNPLRNLPFTLWHHCKYFRLSSCKFKFNKDMSETARIYFQIKENILSYTCQISLGLYFQGVHTYQMLESDYKSLGQSIIYSISELVNKQKLNIFYNGQQTSIVPTVQQLQQLQRTTKMPSQTIKQTLKKQVPQGRRDQKRETCLQKIKTIKQQLIQQQNTIKRQYTSEQKNTNKKQTNKYLNKSKYQISLNLQPYSEGVSGNVSRVNSSVNTNNTNANFYQVSRQSEEKDKEKVKVKEKGKASIGGIQEKFDIIRSTNYNKIGLMPRRNSNLDPFGEVGINSDVKLDEGTSPVRIGKDTKKANRQAQFKIRRKSDMVRMLPQSLRKKLGPKIQLGFASNKAIKNQDSQQQQYILERSATYDAPYLSTQIKQVNQNQQKPQSLQLQLDQNLQIINQRFSEQYQSINDSDNSSEDLNEKQKQYIFQCIKNNKKLKTNNQEAEQQEEEECDQPNGASVMVNINGFKEIRFKSIEAFATKTMLPFRNTKRDPHKLRDYTHNTYKSLNKNFFEQQSSIIPQMVQKKQLNERVNKKNVRQPYFLVQIKNKHH